MIDFCLQVGVSVCGCREFTVVLDGHSSLCDLWRFDISLRSGHCSDFDRGRHLSGGLAHGDTGLTADIVEGRRRHIRRLCLRPHLAKRDYFLAATVVAHLDHVLLIGNSGGVDSVSTALRACVFALHFIFDRDDRHCHLCRLLNAPRYGLIWLFLGRRVLNLVFVVVA